MSLTVAHAPVNANASVTCKLPPILKNSADNSNNLCRDSIDGLNISNNSASKISSSVKYQLNYGMKQDHDASDLPRIGSRPRVSGITYLKNLPNLLACKRDSPSKEEDLSKRSTFPDAASVSLPTSTTTLEYLLHRQGSRIEETDESQIVSPREAMKYQTYTPRVMIKTRSSSDASSLTPRESSNSFAQQFFRMEPCLYTQKMFLRAARILDFLKQNQQKRHCLKFTSKSTTETADNDDIPTMDYENTQEQIKTFELTFALLKFQELFKTALNETGFFTDYPKFQKHISLVTVILYDLHCRKFQKRTVLPNEQIQELCIEIEEALMARKTRLQSFIAKERIKHDAPTIDYLIPESVRKIGDVHSKTPVYLWVNQLRTTMEDIINELEAEGFTKLEAGQDIAEQTGKVFQLDTHCSDLLAFPSTLAFSFKDTKWVKMGQLVQQDKSTCLAVESVQYLLSTGKDVIHVNVGNGLTTAHLASLLRKKSPSSHIWGFGIDLHKKVRIAMKNVEFLDAAKSIKFLADDFLSVDPEEPKLKSVKVILITANCSKSAITNPVQFLINEGEDLRFLREFSSVDQCVENISSLTFEHERTLRHALTFPRVQAIVYATRSRYEAENESVVANAVRFTQSISSNKGIPFRVTPPVLPFTYDEINSGSNGIDDRYIKFFPSEKSNGCFVTVISREPEYHKDSARSALLLAGSKRSLGNIKSTPFTPDEEVLGVRISDTAGKRYKYRKGKGQKLKTTISAPEMKSAISSKLAGHTSPAAAGARMYQVSLVHKMEQRAKQKSNKPDQVDSFR